jgi:hypothetical protein
MVKKYYLIGATCAIVIFLICFYVERDTSILSIKRNEVVSIEIYNASSPSSKDFEAQVMHINDQQGIADVVNNLSKIKPNDIAMPLDANYTIVFNNPDGSKLTFVYMNGVVKTSTGFVGRVQSDNIINRLWANLNYPVQNITGKELPTLN